MATPCRFESGLGHHGAARRVAKKRANFALFSYSPIIAHLSILYKVIPKVLKMASTKDYLKFILEQFAPELGVTARPMMGEYLLYSSGVYFAGIFDDRLLVKRTIGNEKFGMSEEFPYDGSKLMYLIEAPENRDLLKEITEMTVNDLKTKRIKK